MDVFVHALLFTMSAAVLWYFAGLLINAVDAVARRFNWNGFFVAFFVLGFLTSIGEISVMVNSTIEGVPEVSIGNLVGASFVIFLFIVPFLAIVGNGIVLDGTISRGRLAATLALVLLPVLLVLDGDVRIEEGVLALISYVALLAFMQRSSTRRRWGFLHREPDTVPEVIEEVQEELVDKHHATRWDIIKIVGGALLIFVAGNQLVDETVYFSDLFSIPSSLIGLLILSIGTNIPEIVIAVRSVLKKRIHIAFGDYLGSGASNVLIFGILSVFNGSFAVVAENFLYSAILMAAGFVALFFFAVTEHKVSRREGFLLVSVYGAFVATQLASALRLFGL